MKKYGGGYPDEVRFYRPLLEKMAQDDRREERRAGRGQGRDCRSWKTSSQVREASKQPQIDDFKQAARDQAGKDLASERNQVQDRSRSHHRTTKPSSRPIWRPPARTRPPRWPRSRRSCNDAIASRCKKLAKLNEQTSHEKLEELTAQKFDVPNGEIRWVNQRTGTVWINLGRADALQRQVTFSVYPADITDMTRRRQEGAASKSRRSSATTWPRPACSTTS